MGMMSARKGREEPAMKRVAALFVALIAMLTASSLTAGIATGLSPFAGSEPTGPAEGGRSAPAEVSPPATDDGTAEGESAEAPAAGPAARSSGSRRRAGTCPPA